MKRFNIDGINPVTRKMKVGKLANSYGTGAKVYVVQKDLPVYKTLVFHFTTDSRPNNALFEQLSIKSEDLQVGDHAYVINHPLYLLYYPTGAWGGEHSFIAEIDSRDTTATAFRNTLKVEGHGLEQDLVGHGGRNVGMDQHGVERSSGPNPDPPRQPEDQWAQEHGQD